MRRAAVPPLGAERRPGTGPNSSSEQCHVCADRHCCVTLRSPYCTSLSVVQHVDVSRARNTGIFLPPRNARLLHMGNCDHSGHLGLAQLVEECIRSSMEAAYTRLQLAADAAEAPKEEQLTALARGVGGLLDEVEGTFAPALSACVLDAAGVAAASLNRQLGAALRPWLSTGKAPALVGAASLQIVYVIQIIIKICAVAATMVKKRLYVGATAVSRTVKGARDWQLQIGAPVLQESSWTRAAWS